MYKPTRAMQKTSTLLFISLLLIWSSSSSIIAIMADKSVDSSSSAAAVHIIYTEKPEGEEPEAYHLRTLASVLGSEEAAKGVLLYSYKNAASGFSAKLTPEQVSEISKQPGVLQVVPSRTVQLHSGPARSGHAKLHL
uniref:Inhibitor I9 domain-containing protein n=1 Tax=Davidia involucrata TaxID=16924 RepID=A0A5B7AK60_DAVIN